MPNSIATVPTANASRYLQQLCKHFGHKVPVEFSPDKGSVLMPMGTCRMTADPENLTITVMCEDADLARLERIVSDHLSRFAFRENPAIKWQRSL